jgi:hypothetical protein
MFLVIFGCLCDGLPPLYQKIQSKLAHCEVDCVEGENGILH